jgi:uncharacterized membrane protein
MDTLLGGLHSLAWATYVGGALTMDFILRHAQKTMPPSQVGIVCKNAGGRYRWIALGTLLVIGATGLAMVLRTGDGDLADRVGDPRLSLSDAYGQTLLGLTLTWVLALAAVASMAFWLHPAQARRSTPDMTREQIQAERERIGRAIGRMDRVLRFELWLSLVSMALGASLHVGGIL